MALAAVLLAAGALPAEAQQAAPASGSLRPLNLQPPPPDIGIPPSREAGVSADRDQGQRETCAPAWPCRLQLFGVIQRNGGVGLKGTALSW